MILSKSSLLKGFQCNRQLYLYKYHYDLMDKISNSQQAIFDTGHTVGRLAQSLFPGGVDCSADSAINYMECVDKTRQQLKNGAKVIYEAGFIYEDIIVICDIMVIKKDHIYIYEVKSSTKVSDVNILDAAIQYYVLSNLGFNIKDIFIVCINNQYVRKGDLDVTALFNVNSVKPKVLEEQENIKNKIKELSKMLLKREDPGSDLGPNCFDPYDCSFLGLCWKDIPEYSVFNICGLKSEKKFSLYREGVLKLEDIPDDYPLSELQRIQVTCHNNRTNYIDEKQVNKFIVNISYPVYFMDFETFMPAIPMFDNCRPYQQIPFQYSVHYLDNNNQLTHYSFLAEANDDPRQSFIEDLLKVTKGDEDILVYNQSFEITRLKELAVDFPKYRKEIANRIARIKDLMTPFQKKWYYFPEMEGSYSIKKVLPALVHDLSYDNLEISEGGTASKMFESLFYQEDQQIINNIRQNLLDYCQTDTLAMVKIFNVLRGD